VSKIEDISLLIKSFSDLTGVGICFYDLKKFFMYTTDTVREYTGHRCDLCTNVRMLNGGLKKCGQSDGRDGVDWAMTHKSPFFFQCHIGLYELLVPIYNGEDLCGLVFIGQCRIEGMNAESAIAKNAEKLEGNGELFRQMYLDLPLVKAETLLSMGNIIKLYLENLIDLDNVFGLTAEKTDTAHKIPLHQRVRYHIDQHYPTPLTLTSLSETFYVNSSYLSRTFREHQGVTVGQYIANVRLDNAKLLLKNSDYPINMVALNVGYTDANYFVKLFKKHTGLTPTDYRTSRKNGT